MVRTGMTTGLGFVLMFACAATVFGGARIDLRPDPPVPPGGYEPGTDVRVDVYIVDTGNPQGDIFFRGVFLDFVDSPPWSGRPGTFTFLDPDGPGGWGAGDFAWVMVFPLGVTWPLPFTAWVYPLPMPIPAFQIVLPDNGEVRLGHLLVDVGPAGGILDAMNSDEFDPSRGTQVAFGFGGPGDPVTTWRAYTGELTGGVLELPVIPEPASLVLIAAAFTALLSRRKASS